MKPVVVYTGGLCMFCATAKRLLKAKGIDFTEIDVTFSPKKRAEMREKVGGRTSVPQIFIGETHVGGSDDLHTLEREGRLDALLAAS